MENFKEFRWKVKSISIDLYENEYKRGENRLNTTFLLKITENGITRMQ